MKTYIFSLIGMVCLLLLLSSCTRKAFFLSDCNVKHVPAYDSTNSQWKQLNANIINEYRSRIAKPKIVNGANGVIIYKSLPRHQQAIENIICEFWRSN